MAQEAKSFQFSIKTNVKRLLFLLIVIVIWNGIIYFYKIKSVNRQEIFIPFILGTMFNSSLNYRSDNDHSRSYFIISKGISNFFNRNHYQNRKCLEYLLENDIVEYYYYPQNDEDKHNFSTKGIKSNRYLNISNYSEPLPVLCREPKEIVDWAILPQHVCPPLIHRFLPNMMAQDYDIIRNLIKFFKHVAALTGMEYYLNYGSLLGHVRFDRKPIPWDDDIDFSADLSVMEKFKIIFGRERDIYFGKEIKQGIIYPELHVGELWAKVFDASQKTVSNYSWTFPFIDLFYYRTPGGDFHQMKGSHLGKFVLTDGVNNPYVYNVSLELVMPLKLETFLGIEVFIPAQPKRLLRFMRYSMEHCKPLWWHHRFERETSRVKVIKCSSLRGFYDFKVL